MPQTVEITSEMQECIDQCSQCTNVCLQTIQHSLRVGVKPTDTKRINLLAECAEMCRASAKFMCLNARHYRETCNLCADICEACAEECERAAANDEQMKRCGKVCRACAQSCQEMAGSASSVGRR